MSNYIPAEIALDIPKDRREASKWPSRSAGNRLEPFAVPLVFPRFELKKEDKIFTVGSCFARNIEEYLFRLGFDVPVLHFSVPAEEWGGRANGILNKYTVNSMLQEVDRAKRVHSLSGEDAIRIFSEPLLDLGSDGVIDQELIGKKPVSRARALERRAQVNLLFQEIYESTAVILTLGLLEAWYDSHANLFIQGAPSPSLVGAYPGRFFFSQIGFEEALGTCRQLIAAINSMGHEKRIVITTSPVPISRTFTGQDILVANMHSKSTLRVIAGMMAQEYSNVDYFPSYEMVMLSKEPAVWGDDLIHVADRFVGKVVTHMINSYCPSVAEEAGTASMAAFHLAQDDFGAALAVLEPSKEADPTLNVLKGLALLSSGDRENGYAILRENCLRAELKAEQAIKVSALLLRDDDLGLCNQFLDRSIALHTGPQALATLLGRKSLVLAKLGKVELAKSAIEQALATRRNILVLCLAAEAFVELGELDCAKALFSEVVQEMPGEVKSAIRGAAFAGLALVAAKSGDVLESEALLAQAEANHPGLPLARATQKELRRARRRPVPRLLSTQSRR